MAKRKYRPIADCVLLEKLEMEKQTEGGILLPDIVADEIHKGRIIAVGGGMPDAPMFVKPGDIILYFCKRPMTIDEYVLISQRDVYVVIEDEFAEWDGNTENIVAMGTSHKTDDIKLHIQENK